MIKINLLTVERAQAKQTLALDASQKLTIGCTLILVLAGAFIGWRFWAVNHDSTRLDVDIAAAQEESSRLHTIIQQVQQFEQRKAQLQQRVVLIEELRKGQSGPVHMLDEVSRSLPPTLWLTGLKQTASDVVIDGASTSLTGLSDFVGNLEGSGYFAHPIDIITTTSEPLAQGSGELIKFTIKAQYQLPGDAKAATPAGAKVGG